MPTLSAAIYYFMDMHPDTVVSAQVSNQVGRAMELELRVERNRPWGSAARLVLRHPLFLPHHPEIGWLGLLECLYTTLEDTVQEEERR